MYRLVNVKMQLRHNSFFPNLITKEELPLQSRLLDKIIKELQEIATDGGYHSTTVRWLLHTPDDFSLPLFSLPRDMRSFYSPMLSSYS